MGVLVLLISAIGGLGTSSPDTWIFEANEASRDKLGRVINGKQVDDPTFVPRYPGLVALLDTRRGAAQFEQFACRATLVSPTHVLTAAHCVNALVAANTRVLAGTPSLDQTNRTITQVVAVKTITKHP